ncbi:MAG: precorrin-8X methylmutase [Pleurocapsa sp. CRU_1_2]|nr:precorrin-8X methylmutase [Pleurocapsa sp. CRU_1_2]
MNLDFTDASSLATIDRQIGEIEKNITPAQYEIIRQVIYCTADLEYQSLLKFSSGALAKGAAALTAVTPIIVDVPEIQVSIVPKLQKTFTNLVYCCATTSSNIAEDSSKASHGLEILGRKYPKSMFVIGQDQTSLLTMIDLLKNKVIDPSLIIATPPMFIDLETKQKLKNFDIPFIFIDGQKGGANIAATVINSLIRLAWRAKQRSY